MLQNMATVWLIIGFFFSAQAANISTPIDEALLSAARKKTEDFQSYSLLARKFSTKGSAYSEAGPFEDLDPNKVTEWVDVAQMMDRFIELRDLR
ncbi:MAG: hypothetical protein KDD33_13875, partial [Bdellovibrionales bacterium]|nr:hypothetical protein [Bdellovibrionales bacterium]